MFGIKLEKEIKNVHEKNVHETSKVLVEVNKQLEYETAEEREILKAMGIDGSIRKLEGEKNNLLSHKIDNEIFTNGSVLTKNQIKDLAIKYRLRFLRTDDYKGYVPPNLASIIRRFGKENERGLGYHDYQYKFYILAPAKSFKLTDKPKNIDPLIFYKTDNDNYVLVHKWGNDLNILNLIKGWFMKDFPSFITMSYLTSLLISLGLYFGSNGYLEALPLAFFFLILIGGFFTGLDIHGKDNFSTQNWDSNFK